jgi:N-acetylglutamate synthase-like GNAT family acetyltransferase
MAIEISTDRGRLDIAAIHRFLSEESYWSQGISRETVERAVANSLCYGVYEDGRQVGFARVVTDRVRFGYLADVFILPDFRGRGYGKCLIEAILDDPELQTVSRLLLFTRDAHTLYGPFGFETPADPSRIMILQRLTAPEPR